MCGIEFVLLYVKINDNKMNNNMKKINDFTDQELEAQIAMLQSIDVMGSQKLLKSFTDEKERREEERKALEKAKEEARKKEIEKENSEREEKRNKVIQTFSELYGKCFHFKNKNGESYFRVSGILDNFVYFDTIYSYPPTSINKLTSCRDTIQEFKKSMKCYEEIPNSEYEKVSEMYFREKAGWPIFPKFCF